MNQQIAVKTENLDAVTKIHAVIARGDLSKLSEGEKTQYYTALCSSVGLNPLTRPFEYIILQGKLTLYARKDATEQLRRNHGVSIKITGREIMDDCYIVTAQASMPDGRVDESIGAVPIADSVKGADRANALMKAETKAKRRVTLSIIGLGIPDESELETISYDAANFGPKVFKTATLRDQFVEAALSSFRAAESNLQLRERHGMIKDKLDLMKTGSEADQLAWQILSDEFQLVQSALKAHKAADSGDFSQQADDEDFNQEGSAA